MSQEDHTLKHYGDTTYVAVPRRERHTIEHRDATLQLFTHGSPGKLLIDNEWKGKEAIAHWLINTIDLVSASLEDIHIYGCNFAKGKKGKEAVAYHLPLLTIG